MSELRAANDGSAMKKIETGGTLKPRAPGQPSRGPERRNMVTRNLGTLLILRENEVVPTDAEWDECLALLAKHDEDFPNVKVLVVTDGGAPSPPQRKRLADVVNGRPLRVAVISDSMGFRFPASSVAFFLDIATFSRRETTRAYDHLGMSIYERRIADRALTEMSSEITSSTPAPPTSPPAAPAKK